MATSKKDEPIKVEVISPLAPEEKTKEEHKVAEAQAEQMFGKAKEHAPDRPQRLDYIQNDGIPSGGAPPAQGPNISKEEAEFAAQAAGNKKAAEIPEEKTPASTEV